MTLEALIQLRRHWRAIDMLLLSEIELLKEDDEKRKSKDKCPACGGPMPQPGALIEFTHEQQVQHYNARVCPTCNGVPYLRKKEHVSP